MEIFERVNGGTRLSRQQMRNALYCGKATRWLKNTAKCKMFNLATGGSLSKKTMRDREAINRFVSFYYFDLDDYPNGDMDEFLVMGIKKT